MNGSTESFSRYLVMYGPDEDGVGIKGIRSDAPKEAIDAFLEWYRCENRYENGRKLALSKKRIKSLIVDVGESETSPPSTPPGPVRTHPLKRGRAILPQ